MAADSLLMLSGGGGDGSRPQCPPDCVDDRALHSAGARSATITESLGRTTIYLGSLSASLVALALIAQGESTVDDFRLFALLILPAILFLGTVTFVRIVETGIEDATYAQAINRIRRYYLELAREDARYFALGGNDDMEGVLANAGITAPAGDRSSAWRA